MYVFDKQAAVRDAAVGFVSLSLSIFLNILLFLISYPLYRVSLASI